MRQARGGYTIIEVLVVLAVGLVTFFAAVSLLAGRQGKTEFSQAMRDIQTKFDSIVNSVKVSNFPDASGYQCEIDSNDRPRIVSGGTIELGENEQCLFLGKAIQLDNSPSGPPHRLFIYTILGRTKDNSNKIVTDFDDTNPSPIISPPSGPSELDLTETYTLPFGVTILSAHEDQVPIATTDLMGFYNSLQSSALSSPGSQSLITKGYAGFRTRNYPANPKAQVLQSIQSTTDDTFPPGAPAAVNSRQWTICFRSSRSSETTELIVNSSLSGVTTTLNYRACT